MAEPRRRSGLGRRLERQAALPLPRMGFVFLIGAGILLFVLASADGLLWKYSEEREELRARAVLAEREAESMADTLRSLTRENAALRALHRDAVAPRPFGDAGERGEMPPCQR
jgi:hypothetical protein